jgi:acetoin utilization deacetylase AcuC-like enzyme
MMKMEIFNSPTCLSYHHPGHPESPERIRSTADYLKSKGYSFLAPTPCSEKDLLRVHNPEMINAVRAGDFFDPDTPSLPDIYEHAVLSAGSAVCAMQSAMEGRIGFSLMRPPGHHATRNRAMGFCYFNSIAVAAAKYLDDNPSKKMAILDIDCHHGNGTEDIFLGKDRILYVSLHQSPFYPGTGLKTQKNCLNYPLPPFTKEIRYIKTLQTAFHEILAYCPDLLGVSAGFDTYEKDPLAQMRLTLSSYPKIGRMILNLGKPLFIVMEGGYSKDLPLCVHGLIMKF